MFAAAGVKEVSAAVSVKHDIRQCQDASELDMLPDQSTPAFSLPKKSAERPVEQQSGWRAHHQWSITIA